MRRFLITGCACLALTGNGWARPRTTWTATRDGGTCQLQVEQPPGDLALSIEWRPDQGFYVVRGTAPGLGLDPGDIVAVELAIGAEHSTARGMALLSDEIVWHVWPVHAEPLFAAMRSGTVAVVTLPGTGRRALPINLVGAGQAIAQFSHCVASHQQGNGVPT